MKFEIELKDAESDRIRDELKSKVVIEEGHPENNSTMLAQGAVIHSTFNDGSDIYVWHIAGLIELTYAEGYLVVETL